MRAKNPNRYFMPRKITQLAEIFQFFDGRRKLYGATTDFFHAPWYLLRTMKKNPPDLTVLKKPDPKFELSHYRQFIRDAAPYVSLIAGRRVSVVEADSLTDDQIKDIAHLIDSRVKDLKQN